MIEKPIGQFQTLEQMIQGNKLKTEKSGIVMNVISKEDLFSNNPDQKIKNDIYLSKKVRF
jgi:hypothetical protein